MKSKRKLKIADTELARWLDQAMATWQDPETGRSGISGNELANISGVSRTSMHNIMTQGAIPTGETLTKIARALGEDPQQAFQRAYLEPVND